jgi:hypothetical protein
MKLNKTEKFVLGQPNAWHQTALHTYLRGA